MWWERQVDCSVRQRQIFILISLESSHRWSLITVEISRSESENLRRETEFTRKLGFFKTKNYWNTCVYRSSAPRQCYEYTFIIQHSKEKILLVTMSYFRLKIELENTSKIKKLLEDPWFLNKQCFYRFLEILTTPVFNFKYTIWKSIENWV